MGALKDIADLVATLRKKAKDVNRLPILPEITEIMKAACGLSIGGGAPGEPTDTARWGPG